MYETLEIEHRERAATIWMNRPHVHNAFDQTLIAELADACAALGADSAVRVVILAGRGKSFSAGADIHWMKRAATSGEEENLEDARRLSEMLYVLATLPKPTLARVHGAALGGGLGLAAACDLCIATPQAVFATTEVRLGIIPAAISPYVTRAIGERQASRYFLTGERIDARRALALGLVHEIADDEFALDGIIEELCIELLQGGPLAQAAAKDLIRAVGRRAISATDDAPEFTLLEDTARRIARLRATPEARAGLAAFLEKKPAPWI